MYEYSVFDISNPFGTKKPESNETFSDRYVHITSQETLKRREGSEGAQVHAKTLIRYDSETDLYFFEHMHFSGDPHADPLRSFLQLRGLEGVLEREGILLEKERKFYQEEGVKVYFMDFTFQGRRGTNLTLTTRQPEQIIELRKKLGLMQKNLNFADYLLQYVDCAQ